MNFLFTYSEEEKQKNEINRNNANLILNPKFIPLYPATLENLNLLEWILYWFIEFFLSNNDKFYCSNEQLANLLRISESSVKRSIQSLQDKGYVKCKYKIKAWWWKTRFISLENQETTFPKGQIDPSERSNWPDIYNNIIYNNLSNSNKLDNIYSPKENFNDLNSKLPVAVKKEHPQAPVTKEKLTVIEFYNWEDPYVISMMKNANFEKNNIEAINKLLKKWYTRETIQTVCNFIKQDEFWSKQIRSLPKLLKKNPDWVMYIDVMLDKIKQRKPKCVDLDALYWLNK